MKQHLRKTLSVLLSVCMVLSMVAVGLVVSKVPASALYNESGQQWIGNVWVTGTNITAANNLVGGTSGTYYYDPSTGGYGIGSSYPLSWSAQAACAANGIDFWYQAYVNINGSYYSMSDNIITVDQNSQQYCIDGYTNTQTASGTYYVTVPSQGNTATVTFTCASRMWHNNGANLPASTSVTLYFVTSCSHSNASQLVTQYDGSQHWTHCNVCGSNINFTGHSFTQYLGQTQAPTCTANARGTYKCSGCEQTATNVEVPNTQLDHTYTYTPNNNDTHAIGCANCTYSSTGNCEYAFNGFVWAANNESAQVNIKCAKCGAEKLVNATMSPDVHPAHCMDNAYTVFTASYGGYTDQRTVTYQGTAPGHAYIYTSNGNGTHTITCANCNYYDTGDCGYNVTQHAPTTTTGAYTTYTCNACGYSYDTVEITSYPITFVVEGVETVLSFNYGSVPSFPGVPTKASDVRNYYVFAGWDKELSPVTGAEEYVAVFNELPFQYLVHATAGAGATITDVTDNYEYGDVVNYDVTVQEGYTGTPAVSVNGTAVAAPTPVNGVYSYSLTVTDNTDITVADLTKNTYTVTFVSGSDSVDKTVAYGDTPTPGFTPVKAADAQYRYTFTGWSPEIVPATADATYTAQFDRETRSYPVYVKGGAGSEIGLASGTRDYGTVLDFDVTVDEGYSGTAPVVTANGDALTATVSGNVYSYSVTVTGETEIAVSDLTKNTYTITFDVDGTTTEKTVAYGETPVFDGTPVKAATAQYSYTFTGWDNAIVPATADAAYTAQFDPALRSYFISFVTDDGTNTILVDYGETPDPGFVPAKAADATYTYTFKEWNTAQDGSGDGISAATDMETYYAIFDATAIPAGRYLVTAAAGEGTTISDITGLYDDGTSLSFDVTVAEGYDPTGLVVSVNGTAIDNPTPVNGVYSYTVDVTENKAITVANLSKYTYTITFDVDGAATEKTVAYGETPAYDGTPVRASTAQYDYTFTGWDPAIVPATADAAYAAQFGETLRSYDISFVTDDGTTTISVPYGDTPAPGFIPAKAADATYYYTFKGWSTAANGETAALAAVDGPATYYAIFDAELIPADQYFVAATAGAGTTISDITGLYDDGATVSFDVTVAEGYDPANLTVSVNNTPVDNPTPVNGVYSYTVDVTENKTVTVADLSKYTYEITFDAGDETVSRTVTYGDLPAYGKTPVKASTAQYAYAFTDWDETIVPATADKTYTAQFSETLRSYPVFVNPGAGSEISIASGMRDYGTTLDFTVTVDEACNNAAPVVTVGDTVINGTKDGNVFSYSVSVLNDMEISVSDLAKNNYTVAFKNGTADLGSVTAAHGAAPVYTGETPVYSGAAGTTYTFLGWTDTATEPGAAATYYTVLPAADGNATYYAYFGAQQNTYTVNFVIDGQTISKTFPYGATPALGYTPVKAADADYTYSFTGWTPAIETVTGDATYTAVFESTPIPVTPTLYLVKAKAGEGTKINDVTGLYEANDTVTLTVSVDEAYSQSTPTVDVNGATLRVVDPVSGVYTYTINVEGATDITVSDLTKNTYEVAFKDYDGSPLDTVTVEWGEDAAYPGSNPIRPADENYVYAFTGWDVSLNNIKADTEATAVYQPTPVGSHTHQFTVNAFDETGHWMACACGERQDFAAHIMETKHDAAGHWTECACGYKTAKADHVFDEEVASGAATCVAPAYSEMKCACGETKRVESGSVDLTKHAGEIKTFGAREATETVDGYTGDKYCLACGNLVEAGKVIPHTGSDTPDTPVTPDDPTQPDDGGNTSTGTSILDLLRNFFQRLITFFKSIADAIC